MSKLEDKIYEDGIDGEQLEFLKDDFEDYGLYKFVEKMKEEGYREDVVISMIHKFIEEDMD